MKRVAWGTILAAGLMWTAAAPAAAATIPVVVTIRNLAPSNGTYQTPVWVGFHDGTFDLFDLGAPASMALERLAEDGDASFVMADFTASGAGSQQGAIAGSGGPIAPGETARMTFFLDPLGLTSRYFSYASMVIPSNDAFIGNGDPTAFQVFNSSGGFVGGSFIVSGGMVMDAGTEVNDEIPMNTAFFGQTTPNTGTTENGVVMIHPGFNPPGSGGILDSPMFANANFKAPGYQMVEISIETVPEPATFGMMAGAALLLYGIRRRRFS